MLPMCSVDGSPNDVMAARWTEEVERLFPQRLCNLFFFDGEKIEQLADPNQTASVLRIAISSLLGLELIDQAEKDLVLLSRRISAEGRGETDGSQVDTQNKRLEQLTKELSHLEGARAFLRTDIASHSAALREVDERFAAQGGGLYLQARGLETNRARVEAELKAVDANLREIAAGILPLNLLRPQLNELAIAARKDKRAREATLEASALRSVHSKIQSLSESRHEKSLAMKVGEVFEDEIRIRAEEAAAQGGAGLSEKDVNYLDAVSDTVEADLIRSRELLAHRGELQEALADLDQKLAGVPEDVSITEVLQQRSKLMAELEVKQSKLDELDLEIADLKNGISKVADEITLLSHQLAESEELNEKLRNRLNVALKAREKLSGLRSAMLEKHLGAIEVETRECYMRLLRKQRLVTGIHIDPETMQIQISDEDGRSLTPDRLSAGERQLLATAILWALAKLSDNHLPVVIDTPLGRLDSEHRSNLVQEYFPNASHQVILLSTDEEIDRRYYGMLNANIGGAYRLEYSDEDRTTRVFEGYFLEVAA